MTLDHSRIEELMAVDALGGLDGDDAALLERERATHGDCATCRELEAGFAETAGRLAFALPPASLDDSMVDTILAQPQDRAGAAPVDLVRAEDQLAERRARRSRARPALVAAAIVVALMVVGLVALRPTGTSITEASTSQRLVTFTGDTEGTLAMAFTPGEPGAVLWGRDLPDPEPGNVYEIWMIEGGEAVSGGCVAPTGGAVALRVEADVNTAEAMAVTEESADCPSAPTSEPILSADLTAVA
jgi:Anti-sigma-K factor rskA